MNSSNLALRMDLPAEAGPAQQDPARELVSGRPERRPPARFERRAFDERAIVVRDPGLPTFRVR